MLTHVEPVAQHAGRAHRFRLVAALAVFLLCYWQTIATIVGVWSDNYLYSYGFFVPLISGYIVWVKADRLQRIPPEPDYLVGVAVTLCGIAMLLVGRLGLIEAVEELSVVVTLIGFVSLLFGRRALLLMAFPISYLLIGIPIWDRVIIGLQPPSQLLSGKIAVGMLDAVGVPVLRQGTTIVLPNVNLDILRECSGVNQLIAVLAMCLPIAYLWLDGYVKRLLLIVFGVSVAYVSNGFRIAIVGFLNYTGLSNSNLEALHLLEGLATSLVSYLLIFGFLSLLSRLSPVTSDHGDGDGTTNPAAAADGAVRQFALDAAVLVIIMTAWVYMATFRPVQVPLDQAFRALPHQIDHWTFDPFVADSAGYRLSVVDDEIARAYRSANGDRLRLYVGYQRFQQEGKEVTDIAGRELMKLASPVEIAGTPGPVQLGEVVRETAGRRRGTLIWVDLNGRTVIDAYRAKAYTFWDAVTRRRTNGAIVLVEWDASEDDFDASRQEAIGFVKSLWPYLSGSIPS